MASRVKKVFWRKTGSESETAAPSIEVRRNSRRVWRVEVWGSMIWSESLMGYGMEAR
jgi:hypothetical protein